MKNSINQLKPPQPFNPTILENIMKRTNLHKIIYNSLPILLISQLAFAHTEIPYQVTEGNGADIALTIGHGCENTPTLKPIPVVAESVVFPTLNPIVTSTDNSINDLSGVIQQVSLAGLAQLIQNKDIFSVQNLKYDTLNNPIGFYGKSGSLAVNLRGRVPFSFVAPIFQPTSCAKKLNIEVAIADICVASKPFIQAAKVNLWIPNNGSNYSRLGGPLGVDGIGEPAVLQVNRDLVGNPLPSSCGAGVDVTVSPSAVDIDTNLGIPGYWSYK